MRTLRAQARRNGSCGTANAKGAEHRAAAVSAAELHQFVAIGDRSQAFSSGRRPVAGGFYDGPSEWRAIHTLSRIDSPPDGSRIPLGVPRDPSSGGIDIVTSSRVTPIFSNLLDTVNCASLMRVMCSRFHKLSIRSGRTICTAPGRSSPRAPAKANGLRGEISCSAGDLP